LLNEKQLRNFWKKVDKSGDCWEWVGCKIKHGYGRFNVNAKLKLAHRVSWELKNGPITNGLFTLHKCDNPPCVNPDHLFLGTQKDNMHDAMKKGRHTYPDLRGEECYASKLKEIDVLQIREIYSSGFYSMYKIGDIYKTCHSTICHITNRKTWKHLA